MIVNNRGNAFLDRKAVEKAKEREKKRLQALREAKEAEWEMDKFFTGAKTDDREQIKRK